MQVWASYFQPGGTFDHLRSWSDQQCTATSAETRHRLMRNGWNVDVTRGCAQDQMSRSGTPSRAGRGGADRAGAHAGGLIPNARFVQLDSENHMPLGDEPAWPRLLEEVRRFLAEPVRPRVTVNPLPLGELTPRERAVLEGSPKASTTRRSRPRSACPKRPCATTSRGCSTRSAWTTAIRRSCAPVMLASACSKGFSGVCKGLRSRPTPARPAGDLCSASVDVAYGSIAAGLSGLRAALCPMLARYRWH